MFNFKKFALTLFAAVLLSLGVVTGSYAKSSPDTLVFVGEYLGQLDFIEGRLLDLLGAMPQERMAWEPADGVRNTAEVYLHVAEANYSLASKMGADVPKTERGTIEKSTTDKEKVAETLKESFTVVKEAAGNLTDEELNKIIQTPFGMDMSLRNFMISLLNHMHEHLGQGIVYARVSGVIPPWSDKQDSDSDGDGK
ncbi:MAG: DinB family protein [Bacteroidetes bacterium]|nr:DinB family protein [Bacteroidota bacterium]